MSFCSCLCFFIQSSGLIRSFRITFADWGWNKQKKYSWIVCSDTWSYWGLILYCIQKSCTINNLRSSCWSRLWSLFLFRFILSWCRFLLSEFFITHFVKNSFFIRIVNFFLFDRIIDWTFYSEIINSRSRDFTMNCNIIIEITAFFSLFSFQLFFIRKRLILWIKVFLFHMVSLDTKSKCFSCCWISLSDSKH